MWAMEGGGGTLSWDFITSVRDCGAMGRSPWDLIASAGDHETCMRCLPPGHPACSLGSVAGMIGGFRGGSSGKESSCQWRRHKFDPWVRNITLRKKRQSA